VAPDAAGGPPAGGEDAGAGGGAATPSAGSGRSPRPSPAAPDGQAPEPDGGGTPDPNWFDASGLGSVLGAVSGLPPAGGADTAGAASADAAGELAAGVPARDGASRPSRLLLALSLLILFGLGGGLAYWWWDRRPGRYWAA
jgi:hypothetical protein